MILLTGFKLIFCADSTAQWALDVCSASNDLDLNCLRRPVYPKAQGKYCTEINEPGHNSCYKIACVPSEDSDQPVYPRS